MDFNGCKEKALLLPLSPGVYIMRDKSGSVIYVGKAKKLKNRVSQYFQDTASHTPKTRLMVSNIHDFDVIVTASEFEALVLECSLIKRHMPKYNILLKDDKGYPYLRLNMKDPYPVITMVSRVEDDGGEYFGPYGSRGITQALLETIRLSLKLPNCSKRFPKDIGSGRRCLHYHMGQCAGWCQDPDGATEYRRRMQQARSLLQGDYKTVATDLKNQMLQAAEDLNFELAASLRDRLNAVEKLGQKQTVTAGAAVDTDVIGYGCTESKACFTVLHFSDGNLLDKDYEVFSVPDDRGAAVSSLLKQYYLNKGFAPKRILLPFEIEDRDLIAQLFADRFGGRTQLHIPQRGESARLIELANKNAFEEAQRLTDKADKAAATLNLLGKMLGIDPPARIESFDISNTSGSDIVAGMVVFQDGKPKKSDYKRFRVEGLSAPDDYASMEQVIIRRFSHYKNADKGFDVLPDLLLIDGGVTHAGTALKALQQLELSVPVFGMVKDDRHRTRALVAPDGKEIRIDNQQSIFSFIGSIQEEVHRFAITYHRSLRSKRLRYSELDGIPGIGTKRKQDLLRQFKSIKAIREAALDELEAHLPKNAAMAVYLHFHNDKEGS